MSRPALERLRGNTLSRKANIYALCLLYLAQCFYGCRPGLDNVSTRSQPVMVKIKTVEVKPSELQPGQRATFRVWYSVLAPPGKEYLKVKESRRLFFNQQPLVRLPSLETVLKTGDNIHESYYTIPKDAAEGTYVVKIATTLAEPEVGDKLVTAQAKTFFVVQPSTTR
jgi:hypothetical protein